MTLHVASARVTYGGADRLDVTAKSGGPIGRIFAPSWAILRPALDARALAKRATRDEAEAIEAAAWATYVPAFLDEMRQSYRRNRREWEALLAREAVTLVCYCVDPRRCHRAILRTRILPALGAVDAGEVA